MYLNEYVVCVWLVGDVRASERSTADTDTAVPWAGIGRRLSL